MTQTILAIDYGLERIGLALFQGVSPQRLKTLANNDQLLPQLAATVEECKADLILLGLPRTTDGGDTAWTGEVRKFAGVLAASVPVPVTLCDEFGTTAEAKKRLDRQNIDWKHQRAVLDQEAAVVVLEDYLHGV